MRTILLTLACFGVLCAQPETSITVTPAAVRVVGKPYSATQVTHVVRTLANGAHIDQTVTNLVWQDELGRFRQELTGDRHRIVIEDTVASEVYTIDPANHTVQKTDMKLPAAAAQRAAADISPVGEARQMARSSPNRLVEDLGARSIQGVQALGVRITTTIPIGAIGNDQELKSVTERWYSNEIHAMVKTVSDDPRTGMQTYELTNIVRSAPDPSLFQVPAGFTLVPAPNRSREE